MTTGGFPDATIKSLRQQLLSAHNALRSKHGGAKALVITSEQQTEAQAWADYMAKKNVYKHDGYGKSTGQNIAKNITNVNVVMNEWRNSCGHFYNIISKNYTKVGFGISKLGNGTWLWSVHFDGSASAGICNKCPGCTCKSCGSGCTSCSTSGHAFYSNDCRRPGGSC